MKLSVACTRCFEEKRNSGIKSLEFNDDGAYELICKFGHASTIFLQQQKFEVLFEIAVHAIRDGYYREAVSSFAASLERFYEFFIKVLLNENKIDDELQKSAWRLVSNQSERQLGAFIFLYLQNVGEMPKTLSNNNVKFRNEVIHKGKIPNKEQSVKFGVAVAEILVPNIEAVKLKYRQGVRMTIEEHIKAAEIKSRRSDLLSVLNYPTFINLTVNTGSNNQADNLAEYIG